MNKTIRNLVIVSGIVAVGAIILKRTIDKKQKIEDKKDIESEEEYYDWDQIEKVTDSNWNKQKSLSNK